MQVEPPPSLYRAGLGLVQAKYGVCNGLNTGCIFYNQVILLQPSDKPRFSAYTLLFLQGLVALGTSLVREVCSGSPGWKSQLCSTSVVREVRSGSSGWKVATFQYKRIVREVCSGSSGWKVATFQHKSSTRSALRQLRLESRKFSVQA